MKVLHIGVKGNIEKYCAGDPYLDELTILEAANGLTDEEYLAAGKNADVIVADAIAPVRETLIKGMPNLKMIHSEGVAFNKIDTRTAAELGIPVCNNKGMNAIAVAEQTVLLMLAMLRDTVNGDREVRSGHQIEKKVGYIQRGDLLELADCRVGLVGFGDIAKETVKLLQAFGVTDICYNKRFRITEEEEAQYGVRYLPLDELLAASDIVSLHLPVTPSTERMADDAFFAKMKDGAYLVNTSRGELVDDEALLRALAGGRLAMAGLDTLDHEPVTADHPLLTCPDEIGKKMIFSPHIAGITRSSFRRGFAMTLADIKLVDEGKRPHHIVNGI